MNILKIVILFMVVLSSESYAGEVLIKFKSHMIIDGGISFTKPNVILEYSDMEVIYDGPDTLRVEVGGIKIERKIRLTKPKKFDVDFSDLYAYQDRYIRDTKYSPRQRWDW